MASEAKYTTTEALLLGPFLLLAGVVMFILFIPFGLLFAWIRVTIWNWFAVPYLHLPRLSVWVMWGIGSLISTFLRTDLATEKHKGWKSFTPIGTSVIYSLMALVVAAVIHHFLTR